MYYKEFVNPQLGDYLNKLKLDKTYHRAQGNRLYYRDAQGQEVEIKDFLGGYGSLALGHHHPELVAYAKSLLEQGVPVHDQMSIKHHSGRLAKFLSDEIGSTTGKSYVTTFTNSGAETVEAAIKHARFKKMKELNALVDGVHKNLNAISNQVVKGMVSSLLFQGNTYGSFSEFREEVLAANQETINALSFKLLASEKSYHGKTLSALKATASEKFKEHFLLPSEKKETVFFPWDEEFLEKSLAASRVTLYVPEAGAGGTVWTREVEFYTCCAIIIEPILGEGGVLTVPANFLKKLRSLTLSYKIPLILDEIQTGSYRTGTLLYAQQKGISADYYLLGKSLGGGLVKIGALVIDKDAYEPEFGMLHTSTFSGDEYSSALSLKALELLKAGAPQAEATGKALHEKLQALKEAYPDIIKGVLGDGLMLGVLFKSFHNSACYPFQFASRSNYFNYFITSYLLHHFQVRVAPTLSSSFTIRIQPPANVSEPDMDRLIEGLKSVCEVLRAEDFYKFIESMLPAEYQGLRPLQQFSNGEVQVSTYGALKRVGFLTHFINEAHVVESDPSLAVVPVDVIEGLLHDILEFGNCIITGTKVIRDGNGKEVEIVFAGLPFTSGMVREALVKNELAPYRKICHKAIATLSKEYFTDIVGLGQYTSIITSNGTTIPHSDVVVTTGNSFTTYIGLQSVLHEVRKGLVIPRGEEIVAGIIGAAGNISSVYAKCITPYVSKMFLKGSDRSQGTERIARTARELLKYVVTRLQQQQHEASGLLEEKIRATRLYSDIVGGTLKADAPNLYALLQEELGDENPIAIFSDLEVLRQCNLVIVATNAPSPFLTEDHFSAGTIVYDISVPLNVTPELFHNDKNIKVLVGGVVTLPHGEGLPLRGFPLPAGSVYACIAETLLLGLEQYKGAFSFSAITPEQVEVIGAIAQKHKFHFFREKTKSIL
ncbi:aminotransferase class III-fold pyridoxal phosphate-dependent enzyme [Paraflavisolibacter sp. H34]|uniref:aminotransferase class III-fold pyridoxal phosphate-dependent enzyme n=1 Tax=Huijunlia imazamoxiresistens TaxID=3127457 RepID=UPI00301A1B3C